VVDSSVWLDYRNIVGAWWAIVSTSDTARLISNAAVRSGAMYSVLEAVLCQSDEIVKIVGRLDERTAKLSRLMPAQAPALLAGSDITLAALAARLARSPRVAWRMIQVLVGAGVLVPRTDSDERFIF